MVAPSAVSEIHATKARILLEGSGKVFSEEDPTQSMFNDVSMAICWEPHRAAFFLSCPSNLCSAPWFRVLLFSHYLVPLLILDALQFHFSSWIRSTPLLRLYKASSFNEGSSTQSPALPSVCLNYIPSSISIKYLCHFSWIRYMCGLTLAD